MITTSRLLTLIRSAKTFRQATAYHDTAPDPQFKEELYRLLKDRGIEPRDLIAKSGIERSYFYHLLSGQKKPGRNMTIRLGLCLNLNLKEMNHLLQLAGAANLYPRVRRDAALIFAVQNHYTMAETNDLLISAEEEPLFLKNEFK